MRDQRVCVRLENLGGLLRKNNTKAVCIYARHGVIQETGNALIWYDECACAVEYTV
jgi:hypothetical protein